MIELAVYLGAIATSSATTAAVMDSARERPMLWETAPTIGLVAGLLAWSPVPLNYMAAAPAERVATGVFGMAFVLVVVSVSTHAAVEESLIPRPAGLEPLRERWPDWFVRGLDFEPGER